MTYYFLNGINYFNRKIVRFDTISEYADYINGDPITNANFDVADGVNATLILNWDIGAVTPEYVICVWDNSNTIAYRWFVMEAEFTRGGQYRLHLRRDVISDAYYDLLDAKCMIHKGTLSPTDPLIYNREGIAVNQIKRSEDLLKDETGKSWIVGYFQTLAEPIEIQGGISSQPSRTYASMDDFNASFPFASFIGLNVGKIETATYKVNFKDYLQEGRANFNRLEKAGYLEAILRSNIPGKTDSTLTLLPSKRAEAKEKFNDLNIDACNSELNQLYGAIDTATLTGLLQEEGKLYKIGDKYYNLTITLSQQESHRIESITSAQPELYNLMRSAIAPIEWVSGYATPNNSSFSVEFKMTSRAISLTEVSNPDTQVYINFKQTKHLNDAPYSMFLIPNDENSEIPKSVASLIATKLGSNLIDIQLLPYCPLSGNELLEIDANRVVIRNGTSSGTIMGSIFFSDHSSFSKIIPYEIKVENPKLQNETELYRIVSPNYSNYENLKFVENNGIDYFEVLATYKPHNPYINIHMNFKGLNGMNFKDNRGLVLGGDFSLPINSEAWTNYQINNKNYAEIFDRQVEQTEWTNKVSLANSIIGATAGTITAAGVVGGNLASGQIGKATMAAGGSVMGGVGVALNAITREKQLKLTKDLHSLNLQNIQAVPNTLVKSTSFIQNNKIFPFIEYYSCTEEETQMVKDVLKYTGMTIERIGEIRNYLPTTDTFISATIIRMNVYEDTHFLNALNEELEAGVFM